MASVRGVSHCYQRPTYEDWPYSVFTMAHGRSKEECDAILDGIGFAPRGPETQVYSLEGSDLSLVGTAEITVGGYHVKAFVTKLGVIATLWNAAAKK